MIQKNEITEYVMTQKGVAITPKSLKNYTSIIWQNIRHKPEGGLRLTDQGFNLLIESDLKAHKVSFQNQITYNNQLIIWLDNFITCPWYVTRNEIYVFSEKMAVQLVLFSGDIARFSAAKAKKPTPSR